MLPVQRWQRQAPSARWRSETWKLRRGRLFLVPGDSPVGYRLPLGSLPYVPPAHYPLHRAASIRSMPRGPLPAREPSSRASSADDARGSAVVSATGAGPGRAGVGEIGGAVRTALAVEPRDGVLCVFMPPVERLEDYLELVAALEDAARAIGLPVHIEGYRAAARSAPQRHQGRRPIPASSRSTSIRPRAGAMRSTSPTASTRRRGQTRLGADKFMIDGRHTGTGGGNHVVRRRRDARTTARSCAGPIC